MVPPVARTTTLGLPACAVGAGAGAVAVAGAAAAGAWLAPGWDAQPASASATAIKVIRKGVNGMYRSWKGIE
jgi:hypothetical protein